MGKERQMKNICQQSFQAPLTKHSSFILLLFFTLLEEWFWSNKDLHHAHILHSSFFILHFKVQIYNFLSRKQKETANK